MRGAIRLWQRVEMKKKANIRTSGSCKARSKSKQGEEKAGACSDEFHRFSEDEVTTVQTRLLEWYDANQRDLPWRQLKTMKDVNQRAYGVWVSEIMLQQTQVATVMDYYRRWMKKWPTLQDLAQAKLEEVNEMWSGLGYYSRAKRLLMGAQKVVSDLQGEMPKSCEELQKELPGVGRYTAGAIASIAFGQKSGVVDGNVIRVLSRLRMIGADSSSQVAMETFWELANSLALCERPGDLNQSLMELGATVCTPKAPQCSSCPLRHTCRAYAKVEKEKRSSADRLVQSRAEPQIPDIECLSDACHLCLPSTDPWDGSLGVQNFPRKAKKKAAREQSCRVCIVCGHGPDGHTHFLLLQRPPTGLLAGLWEFPSVDVEQGSDPVSSADLLQQLADHLGVVIEDVEKQAYLGEVVHIFSHIHQTYLVSMVTAEVEKITIATEKETRWLTREEMSSAALSTAMRKVFKLYSTGKASCKAVKRKGEESAQDAKKQRSIDSFFAPKR